MQMRARLGDGATVGVLTVMAVLLLAVPAPMVYGLSLHSQHYSRPVVLGERATPPGAVWPVFLSDRAARQLGARVGDSLELALGPDGPWQAARVAKVYRPARYPTDLSRTRIDLRLHLPDLQSLIGRGDEVDSIVVRLRNLAEAPAVAARLNSAALGMQAYTSADLAARNSTTFVVITRFHRAIGFVTILASSIFLLTIMALKGEEMRRQVGAMRLIGISGRTITGAMLGIATGVSLLGTAAGIAMGYVLSEAINAYYRYLFDTDLIFSRITPALIGLAATLSVVLGLAAGAATAWRLLRPAPLDQIRR